MKLVSVSETIQYISAFLLAILAIKLILWSTLYFGLLVVREVLKSVYKVMCRIRGIDPEITKKELNQLVKESK